MELIATECAICRTIGNAKERYPANFRAEDLNARVFSARRLPDRVHYRIVECLGCGLIRSDPVAPPELLSELYAVSTLDYGSELPNLKKTYARSLARIKALLPEASSVLEIGCGNGFALDVALAMGFTRVAGVEPSRDAISRATPEVKPYLVEGLMGPGLFPNESFDSVCLFQVFDHIPQPLEVLRDCFRVLRPGGLLLCLNHNVDSFSARLLGAKSPIIDIEHTYLYSGKTLSRLAEMANFDPLEVGPIWNTYSLSYLARLAPMPTGVKNFLARSKLLQASRMTVPLGNLRLIARRRVESS